MPSLHLLGRLILAAAVLLGCGGLPARAQNAADAYSVAEIDVDVNAATIQAAKDQALSEAQRRGFSQLLDRLVADSDRARLPAADGIDYVRDFTVDKERIAATRYLATLTVRYNPAAVKRLLQGAQISFAETRSRPIVVAPVFTGPDGKAVLWDDPNPWRAAWSNQRGLLVPLDVPAGDLVDMQSMNSAQALSGDAAAMQNLGARRRNSDVMVASAGWDGRRLDVSLRSAAALPLPFQSMTYRPNDGEPVEAMLARAVRDISRGMDGAYKQGNLVNLSQIGTVSALAPLSGMAQWLALRDRLGRVPQVRNWELVSLSRNEAALILHVAGEVETLREALTRGGLDLAWSNDGFWTLRAVGVN